MKSHIFAFILIFFGVLSNTEAGYYNMGAMIQGPRLLFSTPPSGTANVSTPFPTVPSVSIVKPNGSIISSAADAITLSVYTDDRCTNPGGGSLSGSTNPLNATSGTATFTGLSYGSIGKIYLKATASGKKSACSSAIVVSNPVAPSQTPTSFKFLVSGPTSIGTGICTAYTVTLKDEFNNTVVANSAITFDYAGGGTGTFYNSAGCTTMSGSGSIATNSSQTTFYYKSNNPEMNVLQVKDPTAQVIDGPLTVNISGFKLLLSGPQNVDLGTTCYGPYTITHQTAAGGTGSSVSVTVSRNTSGTEILYAAAGCTTPITLPGTIVTNGSGIATFYFRGPTLPSTSGPITLTVNAPSSAGASLDIGTGSGTVITNLLLTGASSPVTSRCTQYYVQTRDSGNAVQPVSNNTTVNLAKTLNAQIYSDYGCKNVASSITIPIGYSQGTFYFKDTVAETSTLTATSSGLTSANLSVTTSAGVAPKIASGNTHTCAVMADKTVRCWGTNLFGQLGNGTTIDSFVPVTVIGIDNATAITTGDGFSCALLSDQTVKCWGYNFYGQLGNGTSGNNTHMTTPASVPSLTGITAISAGFTHVCAISTSTTYCWGDNANGQMGTGSTTPAISSSPVTLSSVTNPIAISSGMYHSCAIVSGPSIKCWGDNTYGQLGATPQATPPMAPTVVSAVSGALGIAVGNSYSCARLSTSIKCWGLNNFGQLGDGSFTNNMNPVTVTGLGGVTVTALSAWSSHACVQLNTNAMKCWGNNDSGQLGNNSTTNSNAPVDVIGLNTVSTMAVGGKSTCAILSDQTARCWGNNDSGQLGTGNNANILAPSQIPGLSNVKSVAIGNDTVCALLQDGTIKCLGSNASGALGNGSSVAQSSTPVTVTGISTAIAITGGYGYFCALLSSQAIKCWGINGSGQLGNNSTTAANTPVDVSGISNAVAISAGSAHACALLANQAVKCWGQGTSGQLGHGLYTGSLVPVDVSGIGPTPGTAFATAVYAGSSFTCALLADKRVSCWGLGNLGQLGNGGTANANTPQDVSGIANAVSISQGSQGSHICAVLTDQKIKCWGYNLYGQVGDNTFTNALSPVSLSLLDNVAAVVTSGNSGTFSGASCALLTDKTMRCWGHNSFAQLGVGNTTRQPLPTQVLSTSTFSNPYMSRDNGCAVAPDKTLTCWGNNAYKQLGIEYLTPVFVLNMPQ